MADNTDDPVADVPPEQAAVPASAPVVSSANGVLLIMFTHILVIIYYRAAWYALETLVFEKYPAIGQYSTFLLIPYLVPLAGMLASVVSSSPGALTAWTLAVVGVASSIMIASFFYVLVFDLPPSTIAFAMSLFRSGSTPPAPATKV
jgi:hypothetical protein